VFRETGIQFGRSEILTYDQTYTEIRKALQEIVAAFPPFAGPGLLLGSEE
jgi:hypothetical protein